MTGKAKVLKSSLAQVLLAKRTYVYHLPNNKVLQYDNMHRVRSFEVSTLYQVSGFSRFTLLER